MRTEVAFWDTSAIVPLCVLQDATPAARRAHDRFTHKAIWWGTPVEVRSSFARLRRLGDLNAEAFAVAVTKWTGIAKRVRQVPAIQDVLSIALELPDRHGIRAMDAFQLAAAIVWCNERPRNRPFVCADKRLGDVAGDGGFDVVLLA